MNLIETIRHRTREDMWTLMCAFAEHPDWDIMLIDTLPYGANYLNYRFNGGKEQ